jgi:hypothetical protein
MRDGVVCTRKSALILTYFEKKENADTVMAANFNSKVHFTKGNFHFKASQAPFSCKVGKQR